VIIEGVEDVNLKVYLAGPISGLSYDGCVGWRELATAELAKYGILGYSPMRHKGYLSAESKIEHDYPREVMSCQKGIMSRDHYDVISSDALLVNLLGCTQEGTNRVTVGTVMEVAWAWDRRIPVVVVMERSGNVHDHPMMREAFGFRVETLEQGVGVVRSILLNG
jgi:nucleoside 2-deoxyribosyltransferase